MYASLILSSVWATVKVLLNGVLDSIGTVISAAGQLTRLFAMQGLRIDESTAMYYLKESGGDLKKAVKLFGKLVFFCTPLCSALPEFFSSAGCPSQHIGTAGLLGANCACASKRDCAAA